MKPRHAELSLSEKPFQKPFKAQLHLPPGCKAIQHNELNRFWGTFMGVPIMRIIISWSLYWGSLHFGKLPYWMSIFRSAQTQETKRFHSRKTRPRGRGTSELRAVTPTLPGAPRKTTTLNRLLPAHSPRSPLPSNPLFLSVAFVIAESCFREGLDFGNYHQHHLRCILPSVIVYNLHDRCEVQVPVY